VLSGIVAFLISDVSFGSPMECGVHMYPSVPHTLTAHTSYTYTPPITHSHSAHILHIHTPHHTLSLHTHPTHTHPPLLLAIWRRPVQWGTQGALLRP